MRVSIVGMLTLPPADATKEGILSRGHPPGSNIGWVLTETYRVEPRFGPQRGRCFKSGGHSPRPVQKQSSPCRRVEPTSPQSFGVEPSDRRS